MTVAPLRCRCCPPTSLLGLGVLLGAMHFPIAGHAADERHRPEAEAREPVSRLAPTQPALPSISPVPMAVVGLDGGSLVRDVEFTGQDRDLRVFKALPSREQPGRTVAERLRELCAGRVLSDGDLAALAGMISVNELAMQHYFLGTVTPASRSESGVVVFHVAMGRIGAVRFDPEGRFAAHYFSQAQIARRFTLAPDDIFDYRTLHRDMLALNANPDLSVDASVRVHRRPETDERMADIALHATERLPLHLTLRTGNYGSPGAGVARGELFVSCTNLTRHFDTLTVRYLRASEREALESLSASYEIPVARRCRLRVFGGRSETELNDMLPSLSLTGADRFAGGQLVFDAVLTNRHQVQLTLGRTWRRQEDSLFGTLPLPGSPLQTYPVDVGILYAGRPGAEKRLACEFGIEAAVNRGSWGGSSPRSRFAEAGADRDYTVWRTRGKLAVPLGEADAALVVEGRAQWSADDLVAAEKLSAAGVDAVRGFHEDTHLGDYGWVARFELRTRRLRPPASTFPAQWCRFSAQPFGFIDAAGVSDNADGVRSVTLSSAGAGVRVRAARHVALEVVHGFPIRGRDDAPEHGRTHVDLVVTF